MKLFIALVLSLVVNTAFANSVTVSDVVEYNSILATPWTKQKISEKFYFASKDRNTSVEALGVIALGIKSDVISKDLLRVTNILVDSSLRAGHMADEKIITSFVKLNDALLQSLREAMYKHVSLKTKAQRLVSGSQEVYAKSILDIIGKLEPVLYSNKSLYTEAALRKSVALHFEFAPTQDYYANVELETAPDAPPSYKKLAATWSEKNRQRAAELSNLLDYAVKNKKSDLITYISTFAYLKNDIKIKVLAQKKLAEVDLERAIRLSVLNVKSFNEKDIHGIYEIEYDLQLLKQHKQNKYVVAIYKRLQALSQALLEYKADSVRESGGGSGYSGGGYGSGGGQAVQSLQDALPYALSGKIIEAELEILKICKAAVKYSDTAVIETCTKDIYQPLARKYLERTPPSKETPSRLLPHLAYALLPQVPLRDLGLKCHDETLNALDSIRADFAGFKLGNSLSNYESHYIKNPNDFYGKKPFENIKPFGSARIATLAENKVFKEKILNSSPESSEKKLEKIFAVDVLYSDSETDLDVLSQMRRQKELRNTFVLAEYINEELVIYLFSYYDLNRYVYIKVVSTASADLVVFPKSLGERLSAALKSAVAVGYHPSSSGYEGIEVAYHHSNKDGYELRLMNRNDLDSCRSGNALTLSNASIRF